MAIETNYLSVLEAARYLGLSPRTLSRYRGSGDGPAFHHFGGRVRYLRADLDAWAAARRRTSLSEAATKAGRRGRRVGGPAARVGEAPRKSEARRTAGAAASPQSTGSGQ